MRNKTMMMMMININTFNQDVLHCWWALASWWVLRAKTGEGK